MTDRLDRIEARAEGLTDLCAEHLRQSIRHVQRNCDIDCNTHEDTDAWDACKQPDRYDGDRMAAALADIPALTAALRAVLGLHKPERRWVPYDGAGVSFATEEEAFEALDDVDVNQVVLQGIAEHGLPYFEVCAHCKTVEEGVCEGECTRELGYLTSLWPCPTVAAVNKALEGK